MGAHRVSGHIVFDPAPVALTDAKIFVRLEDTTYADKASTVIVERILTDLPASLSPKQKIAFDMQSDEIESRHRYSVSVHVAMAGGSGQRIKRGDYINQQSYPVLTFGNPKQVTILVERVE